MPAMSVHGPFITYDATAGQTALNTGSIFRIRDIDPDIPFRRPYSAMFYKYFSSVPHGRVATQPKVEWGQQDMLDNYLTVNASTGAADTSITVTNAYACVAGDALVNWRTGEMVRLDAIDSATQVSTAATTGYGRGWGGSTAATMRYGDRLYKMGTIMTERGRSPDTVVRQPQPYYNYVQIWSKGVDVTKMQENAAMLGNFGKMDEQEANALHCLRIEMNTAMWKAKRGLTVVSAASAHDSGGGNMYQMSGFDEQVTTHAIDLSGTPAMTWELWNEILSPVFDNDPGDRMAFCGKNVSTSLTATARGNVVPSTYTSTIEGITVTALAVDGGTIHIIPDYDGLPPGSLRLVHPGFCEWRDYDGYEPQWIRGTLLPTQVMEKKDTLLAGGTLVVKNDACHAKVDNVPGPFTRGILAE